MHLANVQLGVQEDGTNRVGLGQDAPYIRNFQPPPYARNQPSQAQSLAPPSTRVTQPLQPAPRSSGQSPLQVALIQSGNYVPQFVPGSYGDYTAQLTKLRNIPGAIPSNVYKVWYEFIRRLPQLKMENRGGESPVPVDIDYKGVPNSQLEKWVTIGRQDRDRQLAKKRQRYAQLEASSRYRTDAQFRTLVKSVKSKDFAIDAYQKSILKRASRSLAELGKRRQSKGTAPPGSANYADKATASTFTPEAAKKLFSYGSMSDDAKEKFNAAIAKSLAPAPARVDEAPSDFDSILPLDDPIINSASDFGSQPGLTYEPTATGGGIFTADAAVEVDSVEEMQDSDQFDLKKAALFGIPALFAAVLLLTGKKKR